jgi:Stf0 sulphotransferase
MKSIQPPSNLQQSYLVCSTGRSGSTLLCKTLEKLGCCGNPEEFFHNELVKTIAQNNDLDSFVDYCNSIFEKGLTSRFSQTYSTVTYFSRKARSRNFEFYFSQSQVYLYLAARYVSTGYFYSNSPTN